MRYLHKNTKKNMPKILRLLKHSNVCLSTIARENNVSRPFLRKIAEKHGINQEELANRRKEYYVRQRAENIKRDKKIVSAIIKGKYSVSEIGDKYSLTNQRIQQIAKENGIMVHAKNHKEKDKIVQNMKKDMSHLTYKQIQKKYRLVDNKYSWEILNKLFAKKYGNNLSKIMREVRNNVIVDKYSSGQIAKKVIAAKNRELKSPVHFKDICNVYRVSSEKGYKKFPQIKNRASGEMYDKISILRKIVHMRENKKMTFSEIAEELNKKNIKTVMGFRFETVNTNRKYLDFKRRNYSKKNPLVSA